MSGKSPAEGDEEDGVDLGLRGDVFVVVVLWGVVFVGVVLVLWEVVVLGLVFVMVVVLFAVLFVLFILLLKLLFRFLRAVVLVLTVAMEAADCGRIVRCNECFMAMSSCVLFDRNDDDGFGTGEEVLLIMVVCECLWTQLSVTPTDAAAVLWFVCVCVCVCVCCRQGPPERTRRQGCFALYKQNNPKREGKVSCSALQGFTLLYHVLLL